MSVDHGGPQVGMPQQFLHGANILPGLEQVRRKTMPEGVTLAGCKIPALRTAA
jgi:hypothetical protein